MNPRSLKFQLLGWYAGIILGCFVLVGITTYLVLQRSLVGALQENQLRRARQIAQLLREDIEHQNQARVGEDVEVRYAPGLNDRFVRITRTDGVLLYVSTPPKDQNFDPAVISPAANRASLAGETESARTVPLVGSRKMLVTSHVVQTPAGEKFLVETGAPMDELQADLRKWLLFLGLVLPLLGAIALGGGYVLVKRALSPVDAIAVTAERISSQNLSQRLPVAQTGDELERLSLALNHMIDRLEAAFQHSRRFVADASHELRTPLTVLRGELESFVQDTALPTDTRERLGSALEELERLSNIVEGLFAISRLDAGEAAAEWVPFDLSQLVSATADQMGLLAEDKKIALTCAGSVGVWVEGDRARLKQVVVNLLDNAIKYTPEGGAVSLIVKSEDSKAVLEVADNGMGIPTGALPKVFERFFRIDKARSRDQGGAGLGLSIVKSICAAHHGSVQATSIPGQGSRFRVELPLVSSKANNHKNNHEH